MLQNKQQQLQTSSQRSKLITMISLCSLLSLLVLTINARCFSQLYSQHEESSSTSSQSRGLLRGGQQHQQSNQSYQEQGYQFMNAIRQDLYDTNGDTYKAIKDIVNHIGKPVIIQGSWPVQQLVLQGQKHGYDNAPRALLIANDIDVFWSDSSESVSGEVEINYHKIRRQDVPINGVTSELNTVEVLQGFEVTNMLEQNDIISTAVAIEAYPPSTEGGNIVYRFHVLPAFWEFFFEPHHTLRAVQVQGVRTAVRVAYKAMQMGLPFEPVDIDLSSELLYLPNVKKIEKMADFAENPFRGYTAVPEEIDGRTLYRMVPVQSSTA